MSLKISEYLLTLLSSFGFIQSFFLAIYLIFFKENDLRIRSLGFLIFSLGIRISKSLFYLFAELPLWMLNTGYVAMLASFLFQFLHIRSFLQNKKRMSQADWLHFIPLTFYLVFSWFTDVTKIYSLLMVYGILYLLFSALLIIKTELQDEVAKRWVRIAYLSVLAVFIPYFINWIGSTTAFIIIAVIIYSILIGALIVLIAFKKLIFLSTYFTVKYKNYPNTETNSKLEYESIKDRIISEKLFLHHNLNIKDLSQTLNTSPRILSQLINTYATMNFSDWLNHFRVEEAKHKLENSSLYKQKIASIAYECGFSSLSSFNSILKNKTGVAPSEYRNLFVVTQLKKKTIPGS